MNVFIGYIILLASASFCYADEAVFHCSARPGCEISFCDPVQTGWNRSGFDIEKVLERNEFPITCRAANDNGRNEFLLQFIHANEQDIKTVQLNLKDLSATVDKYSQLHEEYYSELDDLRKINQKQIEQLSQMKRIDEIRNQAIAEIQKEVAELKEEIKELRQFRKPKTTSIPKKNSGKDMCAEFIYLGKCYWSVIHANENTDYTQAVQFCKQKGGKPADILSSIHYNKTLKLVRRAMASTYKYLWLGMTYTSSNQSVFLSNGREATFVTYYPGAPFSSPHFTQMAIEVNKNPEHMQGMFNYNPASKKHGVLCQKVFP